jgi:hypothetical protein
MGKWMAAGSAVLLGLFAVWPAGAKTSEVNHADVRLAKAVAATGTNEAPWHMPDLRLVWQATRKHGNDSVERYRWLRCHSPRVLDKGGRCGAQKRCRRGRGNCWWTRGLQWGPQEPEGWRDAYPSLPWARYSKAWGVALRTAWRLVSQDEASGPCTVAPDTWGGEMDVENARAHGLEPVECVDTWNTGYVRARARDLL